MTHKKGHLLRYLLLTLVAFAGLGASAALATDPHPPAHPSEPHPGLPHPPVPGVACNEFHPCSSPPVTVTVTVPSPPVTQTVTVDRPAPPPQTVTITTPPVTVTTPPTTRTITRTVTKTRTVVKWKTRTVVKWRTKIVKQCPPPKDCEGDCDEIYKGASG